jgi:hypothetical protein
MNKLMFLLITTLLTGFCVAQPRSRDSSGSIDLNPQQLLNAPSLLNESALINLNPTAQKICFDKIFKVKQATSRGPAETCLYINTETGIMAYSPLKPGSTGVCEIKRDLPDFALNLISLKGNTFQYFNRKKKDMLERHVVTNNSQQFHYQFTGSGPTVQLRRKRETKTYCDGKLTAVAYRVDGRPETWYLFGKTFPESITMTPKKYLGNFGVGYQHSDKGTFIIMELESPGMGAKILEIRDQDACFDPAGYVVFEEQMVSKVNSSIQRKREKLRKEFENIRDDDQCAQLRRTSIQFEQQALDRQEQSLQQSVQGNLNQNERTQQARSDATINFDDMAQQAINDTRLRICQTENRLSRASDSRNQLDQESRQRLQEKLACLQQTLHKQQAVQTEYNRINTQISQPAQRHMEKMRKMGELMINCDK